MSIIDLKLYSLYKTIGFLNTVTADMQKLSDSYHDFLAKVIVGIREVSDITGVPVRKLRYWEEKGIIKSVDPDASSRQFNLADIKKIILINELLEDGYTLDGAAAKVEKRLSKIKSLMDLINLGSS
ncbi:MULTISPECIES: MerR family transcriptional regulator [unclassified Brenneria]|uniref:MerR family transcriptional regulator n=1 Tax=unclassified Brenneria TaxID=2634434 RepID=UPI0029C474BE|nr:MULTISPECIES: MerR family transcriptional regulator [unclassified Brenneria]MDX5629065.1 MerR family transcriptional regulator [Brenneria sp. L3-3Z]MDX5696204.1 MerR family transcriptional regulator [Brenneria sp. L4-2C]MEE3660947.1 MerR family transcriptional regulator [Brenneria sp. g21c3]